MPESNETPVARPKHLLPTEATANVALPAPVDHGGATRIGHSNGLRVHSIVFAATSLLVLVALGVALFIIADGRM